MSAPTEALSAVKLALLAKQLRERLDEDGLLAAEPIAIIGMGCRFPGNADTPETLWELVRSGGDAISIIPADRWDADAYFDPDPTVAGAMNSRWGGFIDGIDQFDAAYFGISPREAAHMDPQQRLVLEVAVEALERAGQSTERLAGSLTGVFVASTLHDYGDRYAGHPGDIDAHTLTGNAHCIIANRLSFLYDLRGPSVAVDTACSSSLVAVHLACQSLRTRDSDLALAGGVNVMLAPDTGVALAKWGLMAPDGRCKTFDHRADGFVRSEGCGIVVLKRLADAIADNDPVVAVIRGSASNQDGRSTAMSAPNGLAQQEVVRRALRDGRVDAALVGCVEAHGTGTILGDPIEVEALSAVLGAPVDGATPLALTAVKANIGHLEAAAGIAGLIKAVLCLHHEEVPAAAHFAELNPHISLEGTRLFVPTARHPWPRGERPRFAGVSSFGFGGTNAHVVVEEAPRLPAVGGDGGAHVLVVSARHPDALTDAALRLADHLEAGADPADVCATAALRRTHHDDRLAIVGSTTDDLVDRLRAAAAGERRGGIARGRRRVGQRRRVAFVFSGQGTQWWGMARHLVAVDPVFREALERCDAALRAHTGWSVLDELVAPEEASRLTETIVVQPVLFAIQIALAARWRAWGITPDAVVGHSVGEVAAAHVAGALTLDQAVAVIVDRARFMQAATGNGTMASIALPAAELAALVDGTGGAISIAALNAPRVTVLAGETAAMQAATGQLRAGGVEVRPLDVDYAFHSHQMAPHAQALAVALHGLAPARGTVPLVSTVTGSAVLGTELDAGYWGRNVAQPVRFTTAIDTLAAEGFDVFLEIGPHPVLGGAITETLAARGDEAVVAASLRRGLPDGESMLLGLGQLHTVGVGVDWTIAFPGRRRWSDLPTYPWQHQRHWYDIAAPIPPRRSDPTVDPLLGRRVRAAAIDGAVYEVELCTDHPSFLRDHRIGDIVVVPATAYLGLAAAAFTAATSQPVGRIADVELLEALAVDAGGVPTIVQVHVQGGADGATFSVAALGPDDSWTVHARGTVAAATVERDADDGVLDLAAIRARAERTTNGADLYVDFDARHVRFGPAFRLVETVWTAPGEALGVLAAAPAHATPAAFHPAVLDAAIHPVDTLLPGRTAMYLPIALHELRLHGPLAGRLWSYVRVRDEDAQTLTLDVTLTTDAGTTVAELVGLRVVRTSVDAVAGLVGRAAGAEATTPVLHEVRWRPAPPAAVAVSPGPWLVVADAAGVGDALAVHLTAAGVGCQVVGPGEVLTRDALDAALASSGAREVVYLRGLDTPALGTTADVIADQQRGLGGALLTAQAVAAAPAVSRLWLVTRGAQPAAGPVVAPEQATLAGLAAAVRAEGAVPACVALDLDPAGSVDEAAAALAVLVATDDDEELVAGRAGQRLVARLELLDAGAPQADASTRLVVASPGVLDDLRVVPLERRAPGPGEVEIDVRVTGLNFRDVLIALDVYPEQVDTLGEECSGVVTRVGVGVTTLVPGRRVLAAGSGSFASHLTTDADLVIGLPDTIGFDEAATIPITFLTAHHCLSQLGRLQRGERVLVHAGAGGVGMAAIQLAQRIGAEIFATAGSPHKRALLAQLGVEHVFDSRSLAFADGVQEATGGAGVDVVLNSLNGEFIPRSLTVLAPGGRFLEIGRRDVWDAAQVAAVRPDVDYHVVFLGDMRRTDPPLIQAMLRELMPRFEAGELTPLPLTAFELGEVVDAFRFMAQARHVGKIVVRQAAAAAAPIGPEGTYLVTGGRGGVGLLLARHLAEQGARHLVLLGRRPPDVADEVAMDAIRALGAEVVSLEADVADRHDLARALAVVGDSMPPLRGIVHAAGVLADAVLEHQTWGSTSTALAPKLAGAWHLDELTAHLALDVVALFSAAGTVLGAPGQAGYAAANAFLDAFASARTARGRRTVGISWGLWDRVGMTAEIDLQAEARMARRGVLALSPAQALGAFDAALRVSRDAAVTQVVAVRLDPTALDDRPLLSSLRTAVVAAPASTPTASLVETWAATPAALRRTAVASFVLDQARKVLGLAASTAVDPRQPFQELGLDSLMAVELRNAIGAALGSAQPATLLFDHPTTGALVDRLLDEVSGAAAPAAPPLPVVENAPVDVEVDVAGIAALTEAEAEALLLVELGSGGVEP